MSVLEMLNASVDMSDMKIEAGGEIDSSEMENANVFISCASGQFQETGNKILEDEEGDSIIEAHLENSKFSEREDIKLSEADEVELEVKNTKLEGKSEEELRAELAAEKQKILEKMFDDTQIKSRQSPFCMYPDDNVNYVRVETHADLQKVIQCYRNGKIDERMIRILQLLAEHRYVTSRQLWQFYLLRFGLYIKRDTLNKALKKMETLELIVEAVITSTTGQSNYHVFWLDYNGIRLYSAITSETIPNWKKTDTIPKPYIIKKKYAKEPIPHYISETF